MEPINCALNPIVRFEMVVVVVPRPLKSAGYYGIPSVQKIYRRYNDGLSEPEFYGDLAYKLHKIVGSYYFSAQFIKLSHYKKIGYNINVLQQTACLVVNPITVGSFAFLFNCTPVDRTSDSMKLSNLLMRW